MVNFFKMDVGKQSDLGRYVDRDEEISARYGASELDVRERALREACSGTVQNRRHCGALPQYGVCVAV